MIESRFILSILVCCLALAALLLIVLHTMLQEGIVYFGERREAETEIVSG